MTVAIRITLAAALGVMALTAAGIAAAQDYPSKPIRIIVQFTPGTSTDILARVIAQKMGEDWGQQVIVDNRPDAGAVIGTEMGAKASPDGYTLTMAVSSAFGITLNHIPFKGSADAHTQLIGGQIPVMFDAIPATQPHIKSEIAKWGKAVKESGARAD